MKFLFVVAIAVILLTLSCKDNSTEPPAPIFEYENATLVIAYEVNGMGDIYLFYPYTNTKINITAGVVDTMYYAYLSSFSDDGHELLYTLDYKKRGKEDLLLCGRDDIFSYNLITGKTKRLTDTEYKELNPNYSKDGKQIVYQTLENGNYDIATINNDGSGKKVIVSNPGYEWNPAFIMNDSKILFSSIRSYNSNFYLCNLDGSGEEQLTQNMWGVGKASVSMDNSFFVFSASQNGYVGNADLGIFKFTTANRAIQQLVPPISGMEMHYGPIVSSDSKKMVFRRLFADPQRTIAVADIDGANVVNLGNGTDVDFTKDGKYVIYSDFHNLHMYDIEKKTNDVILPNMPLGFNIEVSRIK